MQSSQILNPILNLKSSILNKREIGPPETPPEDALGIASEPLIDHLRVHRAEIDRVTHVGAAVLERRVPRTRAQVCSRAVEAAVDAAADRHHQRSGAVIGSRAAVLVDAAPEFRERQEQRVAEKTLVPKIV